MSNDGESVRVDDNSDKPLGNTTSPARGETASYDVQHRQSKLDVQHDAEQEKQRLKKAQYRVRKRDSMTETERDADREKKRLYNAQYYARRRENMTDPERIAKREKQRLSMARHRARIREGMTDAEHDADREKQRLSSAQYRARKREGMTNAERDAEREKNRPDGVEMDNAIPTLLKPISMEVRNSVMASLREALGATKLDECVCSVCDRFSLRCDAVRIDDETLEDIEDLKNVIGGIPDDLPEALIAQYNCSDLAHTLSDVLLSRRALHVYRDVHMRQRWWAMVCHDCDRSIKQGKMPKFAISNGFYIGEMPKELHDLTIPERMMTQLATIFSMTRVMRGGRHRCIRSHCVVFDATPGPPVSLLPRSVHDLDNFRVALVGEFTVEQLSKIRKMHKIRSRAIFRTFEFYKLNNHLYADVSTSKPVVAVSEEDFVDEDMFFTVEDTDHTLEAESNREQENIRGLTDTTPVGEQEEENVIERRSGLLDDMSVIPVTLIVGEDNERSRTDTLRDFLIKRSNQFSGHETFFAKMFPHLFPFGRGHPGETRHVSVSIRECVKYYTMLSTRRFAEDELFMLVAFDRIAMQNMYTQTSFRCRRFPHLFEGYDNIDADSLAKVLLRNEKRRQGCGASRSDDDPLVEQFLKTVDIASCAVWGSNAERMQCRRKAFAYQTRYGQPALFLTLTPNTDNSMVMAHYAGVTTVASLFDLLEARLPTKTELRQASLGNDCVSTRLFMRAIDAFIKYALGIDPKTKKATSFSGLFGKVKAYFGMVETQGRGTLHVHFLIWLSDCPSNSAQVERILASCDGDNFRNSVKAYAKSIVSNDLPLPVEAGSCSNCGSSYTNLIGLKIDPRSRQDPCDGLFSAKARKNVREPALAKCGVCNERVSSQHVLRQVLLEKRRLIPAWKNPLSYDDIDLQAELEASCRNTFEEAVHIVDERERYHFLRRPETVIESSNMTTHDVTQCLTAANVERMPYCKSDRDIFQNDYITRRIETTPPSPLDCRMSSTSLDYVVSVLVALLNQHWWGHTASCFKASRSTCNDSSCRYLYPRERVDEASFNASGVELPRKLAHEFINGFNYAIMATFKCNHDIQILFGGTEALDRIYYACKYVTKQQHRLDSMIPIAVAALRRRQERERLQPNTEQSSLDDKVALSRKRVISMAYSMTNRQEVAGPLAALYLHMGTCCYASANCAQLPLADIIRQLCSEKDYQCQLVVESRDTNTARASATVVSTLDDYIRRPVDLDRVSVYEFAMKYFRKRSASPHETRYPFQRGHPLYETHCLGVRENEYVPISLGYRIPSVTEDSTHDDIVKRATGALVLFKPFRTLNDLLNGEVPSPENWISGYNLWVTKRSAFVIEIMDNMNDFAVGRNKASEAAIKHGFGHADNTDDADSTISSNEASDDDFSASDCEYDDFDESNGELYSDSLQLWDTDDKDILESSKLNPQSCPSCPIPDDHTNAILNTFTNSELLDGVASRIAEVSGTLDCGVEFPNSSFMKKWVRDNSTDNRIVESRVAPVEPPRDTEVVELLNLALEDHAMQWRPSAAMMDPEKRFASITEVSRSFTLNKLQHIAFRRVGSALLWRWKNLDDVNYGNGNIKENLTRDQLLFFLGGEGGTGKTRVIGAVEKLCVSWNRPACLLKTALTGKAATIIGGRTLASFLLALKNSHVGSALGIDVIVIDEVSMMYKSQLAELDRLLRIATRNPAVPFGGIYIILVGDFLQLPPVGADPLFVNPWSRKRCSAAALAGYELWRKFRNVVVLVESVRFKNDPEWGEGCRRARLGVWTPEFVNLINSRVVTQDEKAQLFSSEIGCTYVTPDNATRQAINNLFIKTTARRLPQGQFPTRIVADFKGKLNGLSRSDVELIMSLPDNKFGRMAPFLDLVPGMPIQITQNVRPEKRVANGTLGTLEKILFQPRTTFRLVRDSNADMVVKVPSVPPLALIVRTGRGPSATPVANDIDPDLFPLFFDAQAYQACDVSLPRTPAGDKRKLSVRISQFPLVCAVGSTIYKVQGETLDAMVVTEWRSGATISNKPQQPYLLVSRVTSRNAFATLSPITSDITAWARPSQEALEEEKRLKALSDELLEAFES